MKYLFFIMVLFLGLILVSCEKGLDLSGNWIKIELYEDDQNYEGVVLKTDTLYRDFGDQIRLHIHSQSQPGYKLYISLRVNNEIPDDFVFFYNGPKLKGYYEENGVEREIYELKVYLTHTSLRSGGEIKVRSEIKSVSDVKVERELIVMIK